MNRMYLSVNINKLDFCELLMCVFLAHFKHNSIYMSTNLRTQRIDTMIRSEHEKGRRRD